MPNKRTMKHQVRGESFKPVLSWLRIQWNSKAGDLLSSRNALWMGTSAPSAHAVEVTESTGRGVAGALPAAATRRRAGGRRFAFLVKVFNEHQVCALVVELAKEQRPPIRGDAQT